MAAEIEVLFKHEADVVDPAVQLVGLAAQAKLENAIGRIARMNRREDILVDGGVSEAAVL